MREGGPEPLTRVRPGLNPPQCDSKEIQMLSLSDALTSRYLLFRGLTNAGIPTDRACIAVDVLCGPEPDQDDDQVGEPLEWHPAPDEPPPPDDSDWSDYLEWSDRLEAPYPVEFPSHAFTEADARAAGLAV